MEGYINNDTIREDDIVKLYKDTVTCPLCKSILIKPLMCMKCQIAYCKKCIDKWNENNKNCPNNCDSANYQYCVGKNDILLKLKFNCVGCGKEILYNEAESHHESCCPGKTSTNLKEIKEKKEKSETKEIKETKKATKKPPNIKKINPEEIEKLKKQGKEVNYITSN